MSVPADQLAQIIQSGLMNYSPQQSPLDKWVMNGDPSSQFYAQLGANAAPGKFVGLVGKSMLGTQEAQQKNAQQQLALMQQGIGTQQAVQMFPFLQNAMAQAFGQPSGQQGGGPQGGGQSPQGGQGSPGQTGVPTSPTAGIQGQGSPAAMANLGAIMGLMGHQGGQQLIDAAKFQADQDPANVTRLAAAKGEIAQDQAILGQALQAGHMPLAQAASIKLLKDTGMLNVGAMNGNVTTFGGITPQSLAMSNFNPNKGTMITNGQESVIPGAPAATQQMAAAGALGEAAGKPFETTDTSGVKSTVPLSSVLGVGQSAAPRAKQPGAATSPPTSTGPKAADPKLQKALADNDYNLPPQRPGQSASPAVIEARNKLLQDSSDATTAAGQSLQYMKAAQAVMQSKGAPSTGLPGEIRAKVGAIFGTVNATNYQEVAKYLGNAALASARSIYGPRMTQKEVGLQLDELSPSVKMTDAAVKDLLGTNIRNAQYTIDTANRARAYLGSGKDPMSFGQWNQQYFPHAETVNKAPEDAKGAANITARKVLGGKSYYQMGGKWYAD